MSVRAGSIFIQGIDGLQTSGKERLMEKVASTQSQVMFSLVISKMDGVMVTFCALMLTVQGWYFCYIQCSAYIINSLFTLSQPFLHTFQIHRSLE